MRTHHPLLAAVVVTAALPCFTPAADVVLPPPPPVTSHASPHVGGARPVSLVSRDWGLRHTPVVDVVKRARGAVVNIHSERTVQGPASEELFALSPSQNRVNGMGTGIVIDRRGYIVTNQHVVEDVNLIRVRLADGSTATARVLARSHEHDLALLKIDTDKSLPTIPLGTARDLMVGETVIAIGNAYGYEHTVTVGVVSAVGRDVTLNKEVSYKALIQTDASINPGNSGGPLLNVYGELVGVNVAIRAGAQGIGFAIPVDTMIRVASAMLAGQGVVRGETRSAALAPSAGLTVRDEVTPSGESTPAMTLTSRGRDEPGTPRNVVVERLDAGGPAARAGVQRGDLLVKVGDVAVASSLDVQRGLLGHVAGDRVPVVLRRDGADKTVEVVVEAPQSAAPAADQVWAKLGLRLQPVGTEGVTRSHPQLHGGLAVVEVRPEGAAGRAGIQRGDVLIGLHQWEMLTADNVLFVLNHPDRASFQPLRFYILRAGQVHRGWLQLSE